MLMRLLFTFCGDTNETVSILKFMDWPHSLLLQVQYLSVMYIFAFLEEKMGNPQKLLIEINLFRTPNIPLISM